MKLTEIFSLLEREVAPVAVSDRMCALSGFKDNSGIIIDGGGDVTRAIFSLDFSPRAVDEALSSGADLIVTHHPAIFTGVRRINTALDPLSASIARCIKGGISAISMHLNFDAAPRGIDYYLMRGLGGETEENIMQSVQGGGYGRVYSVKEQTFEEFASAAKKEFGTERCRFYKAGRGVKKVASFCGAGADEEAVGFAISNGADVFVSSDMKHHIITALADAGISVVDMTHYASEVYGFARIYASIKEKLGVPSSFFIDGRLL